jgi:hypothetical protein
LGGRIGKKYKSERNKTKEIYERMKAAKSEKKKIELLKECNVMYKKPKIIN